MSTSITFDDFEDDDDDDDFGGEARREEETRMPVDALVPPFGWIPCERINADSVRFPSDGSVHDCTRMAPLYSRSLRGDDGNIRQGQGVQVVDEFEPASSASSKLCAIVESVEDDENQQVCVVRTVNGSTTLRINRDLIKPFFFNSQQQQQRPAAGAYAQALLAQHGLALVCMRGDGNCLFRAASHQVYGTQEYHQLVRRSCAEYMRIERAYFEPFVAAEEACPGRNLGRSPYQGFDEYVKETMRDGVWGDDPELQAICELYQRPCEVYCWDRVTNTAKVLRRLQSNLDHQQPMRLSFEGGGHYNSVIAITSSAASIAPKPGILEQRALDTARSRCAGGVTMASKLSDEIETENAQIEEALVRSRQLLDKERAGGGMNLQEALELSLRSQAVEDKQAVEKIKMQSMREIEDAELARMLQESMEHDKKKRGVEEEDDDDELLRLAIEESLRS